MIERTEPHVITAGEQWFGQSGLADDCSPCAPAASAGRAPRQGFARRGLGRIALAGAAVLAIACAGDDDPTADTGADLATEDPGPATVEVGTGFASFEAIEDGQTVPIIQGMQGGFHVWGGVRATGFDREGVFAEFTIEWNDRTVAAAYYDIELLGDEQPYDYSGVAVVFEDNDTPDQISGQTVTLKVILRDTSGTEATDSIELVPECCIL